LTLSLLRFALVPLATSITVIVVIVVFWQRALVNDIYCISSNGT